MVARSKTIKPLVAARPSYINPVLLAKMISAFDQLSGGRICINLIAGQSESEVEGEGIRWAKEERYEIMEEEVSILKALWTTRGPLDFDGKFHKLTGAQIRPRPLQQPYPRFYLGGGSRQAWEISAKHSDVHLFWGDLRAHPRQHGRDPRDGGAHGRENDIGFGMRLQIVCRETEAEAWDVADELVRHASERQKQEMKTLYATSEANRRVQRAGREHGDLLMPHLWTGITKVRPGAGIAVVGNPEQCADTLQQFIDVGCHSFCLSGYLHDEEAERFGRLIRPILAETIGTAGRRRAGRADIADQAVASAASRPMPSNRALRRRARLAEQIALHLGAAELSQQLALLFGLDAFGGRDHVAGGGDIHHACTIDGEPSARRCR